jgi:hypothetical protein
VTALQRVVTAAHHPQLIPTTAEQVLLVVVADLAKQLDVVASAYRFSNGKHSELQSTLEENTYSCLNVKRH